MSVLVVGGAGYIGKRLVERLEYDEDIVVVDKKHVTNAKNAYYRLDVCNSDILSQIIKEHAVKDVFHFASYISVEESEKKPLLYRDNNIVSTIKILNAMRENGCRNLVFASSAAVHCNNVYGETKRACEDILRTKNIVGNINTVALRFFNVCGNDPDDRHLIPQVVGRIKRDDYVMINGTDYDTEDGTTVRDYIHVDDCISGVVKSMQKLREGCDVPKEIELGTGKGISTRQVVKLIEKEVGKTAKIIECPRRAGDDAVLVADIKDSKEKLNWEPEKTIVDAIQEQMGESKSGKSEN